ncbi:hypothetical protein LCL95_04610 [Bacillus timonensis]|nr:hypothetical protein [Bacillus timonensis]
MENNADKPKFNIGDIVVITLYGTVGTITNVKNVNGSFAYEVNNSEELYLESSLVLFSNFDTKIIDSEQLDIKYYYYFGDLVIVEGYGTEIFKVIGVRTEIWRNKEGAWEEITYELSRIRDGEWLEAGEDELTLIADSEHAEVFLQKLSLMYVRKKDQKSLELPGMKETFRNSEKDRLRKKQERKEIIDGLLDVYNDYAFLYKMFKDEKYKEIMEVVLLNLKKFTNEKKKD